MRTWSLQDARNHHRDVIDSALLQGPQRITRYGKQAVILVSEGGWNRLAAPRRSFGELLADSPLDRDSLPSRRPARVARQVLFD
jgi:antitoxin Phd